MVGSTDVSRTARGGQRGCPAEFRPQVLDLRGPGRLVAALMTFVMCEDAGCITTAT